MISSTSSQGRTPNLFFILFEHFVFLGCSIRGPPHEHLQASFSARLNKHKGVDHPLRTPREAPRCWISGNVARPDQVLRF